MATHAIRIHGTGGPEVLSYEAVDIPAVGPKDALVLHRAIGVNFIDTYHRSGLYPLPDLPHGLGVEAAGIVEAVGPEVQGVGPGDRVAYVAGTAGTYAEVGAVPADRLVPLPDEIDFDVAAASLLKGMTVEYLVRRTFPVKRGMTVLFHAAAGGVGQIACQWLHDLGAVVIGTVGSTEKAEIAREKGCAWPVNYTRQDFREVVRELTDGQGVPVVYDSVGQDTFDASLDCLAPRGMLVAFGNASGAPGPFDPMRLARGSLSLIRPSLFDYVRTREELLLSAGALFGAIRRGAVTIEISERFALKDASEAHRALEGRRTTGSLLIEP